MVHPGVYAVGRPDLNDVGRAHAALLYAGGRSALSHTSTTWLFGLHPAPARHHITTTRGSTDALSGVVAHRVRGPLEIVERNGLRTTTLARALLDIAHTEPFTFLQRALNEADYRRLITPDSLSALLEQTRGHRGQRALKGAMLDQAPTRSHLEDRFFALIRATGLPRPEVNVKIAGYECDFVWPKRRLIIETDGWAAHGSARRRRRDARRDAVLRAAGWRIERVPRHEVERDPYALVARLSLLLAAERPDAIRATPGNSTPRSVT